MKIFGLEIRKAEKRDNSLSYVSNYSDALTFSAISNLYAAMNISAVYRAVELISDSVAILPIKIRVRNLSHTEDVQNHSLNFVFNNMNITKHTFMKMLVLSVLLKGNGFAFIERNGDGVVKSLRYLESKDVQINYNKNRDELYYTASIVSNKKIEPCNMIHLVKNSYDGINGISIISYATRTVGIANNTENSANAFFTNGCNLAGVLTVEGSLQLPEKVRLDIKSNWMLAYSNGGSGVAILQGNMKYLPIQLNAADSQLLESRLYNVQDIARFFGISPVLLGDLTHSSYATIEAAQQEFILHTLQPYINLIEEEFNRKLILPSEKDLYINLDETYLLKSDKAAQASYYSTLVNTGIITLNEARKELGYSECDDKGMNQHHILFVDTSKTRVESDDKEEVDK